MNNKNGRVSRIATSLLIAIMVLTMMPLGVLSSVPPSVSISEIRIDQPSTDNDEYFELAGTAGTSLAGLTYLVIGDGTGGSGVIEAVVNLDGQAIPASGYFVAAEGTFTLGTADLTADLNFENSDNVTHLLVSGFSGASGADLDTNDDGVLDVTPWTEILDLVALVEEENPPAATEYHYGPPSVGPDDAFVPGHAFVCPAGWMVGAFDPVDGQDTPGAANPCGTPSPTVSIYDIQYTTDPSGNSPYVDQEVTTEGIVTAVFYTGYFIEDPAGGAWTGLWVYDSNVVARGDRVRLTGTVVEYYGLTELKDVTAFVVESSGNPVPGPEVLATGDVSQEKWEGVLVRVENVTVTDEDLGYGEWSVSDGSGDVVVDDKGSYTYTPANGDALVAVIGPLDYGFGAFKIQPRDDDDIIFPPAPAAMVINEIHADPDSTIGDANNDGAAHYQQDEFVEIVNDSDNDIDISGWTLADEVAVRHVFPAGTVVTASCSVVVFGGGTPSGGFDGAVVQTASTGQLGLNNSGDTVTLNDGIADQAVVGYGSEGGNNQSLTRDPDVTGAFAQHSVAAGSGGTLFSPGTMIDGSPFAGCAAPEACGDEYTPIYTIQGNGSASPLVDTEVSTEGIVVGDFQGGLSGFFIQDALGDSDTTTSDGVFVQSTSLDVSAGDHIRVRGRVEESYGLTRIGSVSKVWFCSTGGSVAPTTLSLPVSNLDDLEAFEGMLVTFPQALYISEHFNFDRFGEIVLAAQRQFQPTAVYEPESPEAAQLAQANLLSRITLDDGLGSQNPDPAYHPDGNVFDLGNLFRGGDTVQDVTGVLDYAYSLYRIQPTAGAAHTTANPRPAQPENVGGNLKVASLNVLNYFTSIDFIQDSESNNDPADDVCGPPGYKQECRGADTDEEFQRQRAKIIAVLDDMDADVVGLIEIENNETEALADLVDGLNAAAGAGTYAYVDTGYIGTDAIKVAFIYKPATASLVGDHAVLDDPSFTDPLGYGEQKSRPALAQTFMDNSTGGVFTVVVNHLKSKGSTCDTEEITGDDDPEQGSCNLTRTLGAQALVAWLATDPTGSSDGDFAIIGDLNAYDKEDPIDAVVAGGYTDLIADFQGEYAYSYVFDGQLGYLDHALANGDLKDEVTGVTVWHINADEPDLIDYDMTFKKDAQDAIYAQDAYRSSDHDPVIVGLDVCDEIAPELQVSVTPDTLWPANHKYVEVLVSVDLLQDNFDLNPLLELVKVESSEPDDGLGDGDTPVDIEILDDFNLKLRAERSGTGDGRFYTITYRATDACGNSTEATATVTVPHDKGK